MRCYSISLSKTIIVIVSVIVLFVVASADDENPASLSSWGLSSIINNDNNNKDAPNEDSVIVAPANSDFIIADTPPSCSANQKQKNKVRRQLSCKLEDRKSTAPTGQVEPGQEGNDPNINKNPKEAAGTQITPVDYADFIRDRDLCPVAYVGFQRIFAVCDHGSLMSRVILHDIVVLFDVTPGSFCLSVHLRPSSPLPSWGKGRRGEGCC